MNHSPTSADASESIPKIGLDSRTSRGKGHDAQPHGQMLDRTGRVTQIKLGAMMCTLREVTHQYQGGVNRRSGHQC